MFKVYSSSAGSGKTYTLTKEYLKLALHSESDTYFRSILAVTFTNAAANEMKDRILSMLRAFAAPEGTSHPMLQDLIGELYPGIEQDKELFTETCTLFSVRAQNVFRKILHRYSDFSVMTIDKFTNRLVSSFTDELGIPFGFETLVDSDQISNAVDRMLARIGQEGEGVLTQVMETYYRESAEGGKSWGSLPHKIREAALDLMNETSYLAMQNVADLDVEDWVGFSKKFRTFTKDSGKQIQDIAAQAMACIENAGLGVKDFTRGDIGIYGFFENRASGQKLWDKPNSYASAAIENDKWCTAKTPLSVQSQILGISSELGGYYNSIKNLAETLGPKVRLMGLLDKHLYNLSLLGEIRKEFDSLLRQNNQVHISEFNRKVMDIVAKEPVPFIFERLGDKYNHILVDEFQDTSKMQFANLLPLLDNALGFGHFNLIVGDAKQSIYRFRGGDMDLIMHLAANQVAQLSGILGGSEFNQERLQSLDYYLDVAHLQTNRRSYREITDFNNAFFDHVANHPTVTQPLVAGVFDENFKQKTTADVKRGGHVQIEFLTDTSKEESESESPNYMVVRTLELVEELREKGYSWRDIAILCRKKNEATAIAGALKERGYPLISDDSLLLTYSQSVNLLVSFMKVVQSPDNALARYEAAYLFHRVVQQEIPNASRHEAIRTMCSGKELSTFLDYFSAFDLDLNAFRLRQLGVYELCEKLIANFQLFQHLSEGAYVFRFLDAVLDYGTKRSNHLADFLTYWETAKTKLSITVPAHADALRITTIHKSKGLEYPVVIIPNAHWTFKPKATQSRIWVDLEKIKQPEFTLEREVDEVGVITRHLKSSVVSMVSDVEETALAPDYEEESVRTLLENLNLLYVAFTRPIQRLYVLAKNEKDWSRCTDRVNRWLHEYLVSPASPIPWEDEKSVYIVQEGSGECSHSHVRDSAEPFLLSSVVSNDRTDRLRLRRLAERIFDIETFEQRKDIYQKLRYAFSYIEHENDLPKVMQKLVNEGIVEANEANRLQTKLNVLLQKEPLHQFFAPTAMVRLKREFLLPGGKSVTADRLVTLPDGSTCILNIVAGLGNDDARRQLRRVQHAFHSMYGVEAKIGLITLENEGLEWVE
ncbi:UvrD-helicase domain-containing protein [Arundinibacter roseus]|uniref:DNA 3'-5' helicase n=1 Tax=Arundinibacter roseus TaxID=2070510 RepID=A0A4R4K9S0_9BACT|nr:UvrD-helicase domain-containing protein [Arundinibacter roseus]TDB64584.1 DNA helicase UvrD [Arundinibacter roseus]